MHYKKYKTILSPKNGINIFRGCSHGCIYCDSRSKCYQMSHDFEDIEVKENAVEIFESELLRKRKPCMIGTGAMCDPYIHIEGEVEYTRKCLESIERHGFGVSILTKSNMILRDIDLIKSINEKSKCVVQMTLTTFDENLCRKIEPDVCTTKERFEVLKIMRDNGIPTIVWLCPLLPFINDTEENLRGILSYCFEAKVKGILCWGIGLTLREGNREYFYRCLDKNFPGVKEKYIKKYGNSYHCTSDNNNSLMKIFYSECKANNVMCSNNKIFKYLQEFPSSDIPEQMSMF